MKKGKFKTLSSKFNWRQFSSVIRERREGDPSSWYKIAKIRHNFLAIRDKNINFILCQFQNRNVKHSFCEYNTNLWNWHWMKFTFLSLIPRKLCLILTISYLRLRSRSRCITFKSNSYFCLINSDEHCLKCSLLSFWMYLPQM